MVFKNGAYAPAPWSGLTVVAKSSAGVFFDKVLSELSEGAPLTGPLTTSVGGGGPASKSIASIPKMICGDPRMMRSKSV